MGASRGGKGGVTGNGVTLAWDEFQTNSADNTPSQQTVPSNTVSMDDLLFTRSLPGLQGTSTPADDLDQDDGDRTPNMSRGTGVLEGSVSRGSSPSLPDHKTVQDGDT